MAALEPEAPTRAAMSDAFSVVEMSVEEPSSRSPFLAALTGHGTTSQTTNHVAAALAHKVVHDTRFVEVHIEQTNKAKALKHAQSSKATTGDAPAAGHEDAFSADFHMDADIFSALDVPEARGDFQVVPGRPWDELEVCFQVEIENQKDLIETYDVTAPPLPEATSA